MIDKEKIRKKNQNKLKSFRNKMGSNIVWFDSLPKNLKYDLLFEWELEKYKKKNIKFPSKVKKKVLIRGNVGWSTKVVEVMLYPASLKHFIKGIRSSNRYKPTPSNIRSVAIDILLKNN